MGYRTNKLRHPTLRDWPVGEWCPAAVDEIGGYPKTAEAYAAMKARLAANRERARARGRLNRRGVPNGYAGEGHELSLIRENARCNAERVVERVTDDDWDWRAKLAMQALFALALDPTLPAKIRIRAARTVLEYLAPKPVAEKAITAAGDPVRLLEQMRDGLDRS
jgi:hypothetical protein